MRRALATRLLRPVLGWLTRGGDCAAAVTQDVRRWDEAMRRPDPLAAPETLESLFVSLPEFRTLFYRRVGNWRRPVTFLKLFFKPLESCYLSTPTIGGGLFLQHAFSTIVAAKSIGENCWINQNVTVGYTDKGNPTIGNNVRIHAGAIVIGPISIGDNAVIGAGAVVVRSVAPGEPVV